MKGWTPSSESAWHGSLRPAGAVLSPGQLATIKSGLRGTSGQVFSSREATGGAGVRVAREEGRGAC